MEAGDLKELEDCYRQEAGELLADLGDALLLLERDPGNAELINRVFRAMHTLKGSGASAGFRRLANFVHHVEEVFNRIRNGELQVSPVIVDASLKACDCCAELLAMGTAPSDASVPLESEVLSAIQPYLVGAAQAPQGRAEHAPSVPTRYRIGFRPNPEIFFSGTDPASLFLELSDLGAIHVECESNELLTCDDFDPERSYLAWQIELETTHSLEEVRSVFQFVEDDCAVSIAAEASEAVPVPAGTATEVPASDPAASNGLSSIRVDSVKLDALMRLAGELLTARGALPEFAERLDAGEAPRALAKEMRDIGGKVARLTDDLQATVMSIRMMPVRHIFQRFPRLVRDLARTLDKPIDLKVSGEETELDKTVIDGLGDLLTHIIRNAADHGIESRADRERSGKAATGLIELSATARGSNVIITVRDDGKGLDPEKLKRRAIEKGVLSAAAAAGMDDQAAFRIILAAGFSTVDKVTDLSGRGVGMDVVRNCVEALNGAIRIESKLGEYTCFHIELPASLLVSKGIRVAVSGQQVVLPIDSIRTMVKIPRRSLHLVRGQQIAYVRGQVVPVISLSSALSFEPSSAVDEELAVAIIDRRSGAYGLVVDRFIAEVEVVVKPLKGALANVPEYVGAAIMGDGRTVLVVNTEKLQVETLAA